MLSKRIKIFLFFLLTFSAGFIFGLKFNDLKEREKITDVLHPSQLTSAQQTLAKVETNIIQPKISTSLDLQKRDEEVISYEEVAERYKNFGEKINKEVDARFKENNHKIKSEKIDLLKNRLDEYFYNKKFWYKAVVSGNTNEYFKSVFFINFYNCNPKNTKLELANMCFVAWYFLFHNQKWEHYTTSSVVEYFRWKNGVPYLIFFLENYELFFKETKYVRAMIPIIYNNEPIYYLKFDKGLTWITGENVEWSESSEGEANKFRKFVEKDRNNNFE